MEVLHGFFYSTASKSDEIIGQYLVKCQVVAGSGMYSSTAAPVGSSGIQVRSRMFGHAASLVRLLDFSLLPEFRPAANDPIKSIFETRPADPPDGAPCYIRASITGFSN